MNLLKAAGLPDVATIQGQMDAYKFHHTPANERARGAPTGHHCLPRDSGEGRKFWKWLDDADAERPDAPEWKHDEREDQREYALSPPCPNPNCAARGEDCRVCFGNTVVPHTLGFDDPELDAIPPGW